MIKVRLDKYVNRNEGKKKRLLWDICWRLFGATTPRWMLQGWRCRLLRFFGAKVGRGVSVHGGARIWLPHNLEIGEHSWVGDLANIYCVAPIRIGAHAVVSEAAFLCTAEHDISDPRFELKTAPITIGDNAWVGSRAIVLPGRTVGEGAVVAAGAVVTKDVAPWTVVAGNPARVIKTREIKNPQADISVVIMTKDEKLHVGRCLERLVPLMPRNVIVVDCGSEDGTVELVEKIGEGEEWRGRVSCVHHDWPGTQASQFNWVLDEIVGDGVRDVGDWILRLDADEYLTAEGIEWLRANLAFVPERIAALDFILERKFMGGEIRHGTNGIRMVRLFRRGKGRYGETLMDERLKIDGETQQTPVVFYDDNLQPLPWWKVKHLGYAVREARQALEGCLEDRRKAQYYRMPPYFRVVAYFLVRYVLKGGFLDGVTGWRWHFWQGFWYRWQCDREIGRLKRMKRGWCSRRG